MELLERTSQLQALHFALDQVKAREGEGCVALVYGEAGIGKSTLVEHFLNECKNKWRILQGACDSLFTPRPLGPLYDIALQTRGQLLQLLDSESNRTTIFSACLNQLQEDASILVIEDVHWADEATLDLLKYLGRRIHQTVSMMLLTYRDDELGVDHPLRILLGDLASSQSLHRIPVSQLSKDAVHELAKNREVDLVELHRLTDGNPFYVTEVLAVESGIPETIRDAVLARAARLSLSARAVLEAAAVIGSRVEPWLLTQIAGIEPAPIEECIARGMLHSQADYYVFRHELTRQTILESISFHKRLEFHRRILDALKDSPDTRNDWVRLANHAEELRDGNAVLEFAPVAARQASARSSHREATSLYELALRFADSLPPAEHAGILEAYIQELEFKNRVADAIPVLQKTIEIWRSLEDRLREGANLEALAEAYHLLGRNTESEDVSKTAIAMLEALSPSAELARAYKGQCYIRMMHRDCTEAIVWGEKAIALAEHFGDIETLARTYDYLGSAMLIIEYERGRMLLEKSLALGHQANLTFTVAGALDHLGEISVEVYELTNADAYLAQGIKHSMERDDDYHLQSMLPSQVLTRLYQGRWVEAGEIAAQTLARTDLDIDARSYALLALGRLHARQGMSDARSILEEALKLSMRADSVPHMGRIQVARLEEAWLTGENWGRVLEETRLIYNLAVGKKHPWIVGELAFWRWRVGDKITPPDWIARPFAMQIAGDWRAAATEWEQLFCPYEQGMALMDGDEAAQREAFEIFDRLGGNPISEKLKQKMRIQGARLPRGPRPSTRENPFGLTAREMEILSCLTEGSSNNAIASQLSLSIRTVEHHITSILQKMEIQSRNEAAARALKDKLFPS
jgi:DNA-binding CsgD family transcriptional regulator/tetratricopeptide (TPR) repeat protein